VVGALKHFQGTRYLLDAFVVMPNHVHALLLPLNGHSLSEILHSWKSFTGKELKRRSGTQEIVWQDENYDRIVRDEKELQHFRDYIEMQSKQGWFA
jgi:type I restriction enzyme R subunit